MLKPPYKEIITPHLVKSEENTGVCMKVVENGPFFASSHTRALSL
jgi:hypothetical protein